ncbi:MAG: tetratricopeptide repeat protein [Gammaproteobacteria bacterium]|nr:tetratricopeptide repeat protein [Gammaproteobacteria bacterium]MBI5616580.1 tetratricopeptide repeat protein [Gammaproteobacteria bacterium]
MLRQIARNTVFALALAGGVATAGYAAEPTLHEVFEAVEAGKLGKADTMMGEVLKAHPDSAKAHFVHAEVLAREGRRDEAREALATAEKLAPGLTFAKPSAVAHLREMINGTAAALPVADGGAMRGGHSLMPIVLGVGGLLLVMFVVRARSARRNAANPPTAYGAGYGGAQGGPYAQGPYGGGPAPMGGSGPGLGSSLASGLAVGAGIAAGEALVHRVMDGNRTADPGAGFGPAGFTQANRGVPEDQDFGVNDSSSWGDNSGYVDGGDLGGGDIGGDDWS